MSCSLPLQQTAAPHLLRQFRRSLQVLDVLDCIPVEKELQLYSILSHGQAKPMAASLLACADGLGANAPVTKVSSSFIHRFLMILLGCIVNGVLYTYFNMFLHILSLNHIPNMSNDQSVQLRCEFPCASKPSSRRMFRSALSNSFLAS